MTPGVLFWVPKKESGGPEVVDRVVPPVVLRGDPPRALLGNRLFPPWGRKDQPNLVRAEGDRGTMSIPREAVG